MPSAPIQHTIPSSPEEASGFTVSHESNHYSKIIHGDCLKKLPEIKRESVHLTITDPPYFLDGLDSEWKKGLNQATRATGTVGGLPVGMKFDPKQGYELQKFIKEVAELMLPCMVPGAFAVVFSQPRLSHRMAIGLEEAGFEIRDLLAWHFTCRAQSKAFSMNHFIDKMDITPTARSELKKNLYGRKTPQLRPQFETMVLAQKPRVGTFINNWGKYKTSLMNASASLDGKTPSTLMVVEPSTEPSTLMMTVEKPHKSLYNGHLTVKPVQLIKHLIELFSVQGQVVLDPFLGSGTTAVAAKRSDRSCIGIEINKHYVEIAKNRIEESNNDNQT